MLPVAAGRCQEKGGAGASVTVIDCTVASRTVAPSPAAVGLGGGLRVRPWARAGPRVREVGAGLAEPPEPLPGPLPGVATVPQATAPLARRPASAAKARLPMHLGRDSGRVGSSICH